MYASREGRVEVVKLLLAAGVVKGRIDGRGNSTLTMATEWGHHKVVELLQQAEKAERGGREGSPPILAFQHIYTKLALFVIFHTIIALSAIFHYFSSALERYTTQNAFELFLAYGIQKKVVDLSIHVRLVVRVINHGVRQWR